MRTIKRILFSIICVISSNVFAGVLCEPAVIRMHSLSLYNEESLNQQRGYAIEAKNTGEKDSVYSISFLTCQEAGKKPRLSYYDDIPTADWFIPKSTEIIVPAKGVGYVKDVYVKIPKNKKYYGRKFQGYAKVEQISPREGMFNVEVLIPIFIETKPKPLSIWNKITGIFKKKK